MSSSTISTVNKYLLSSTVPYVPPGPNNNPIETNQIFPYDGNGINGELKTTLINTTPYKTLHNFSLSTYTSIKNGNYILRSSSSLGLNSVQKDAQLLFSALTFSNYTGIFMFGRLPSGSTWNGYYNDSNVFKTYTQNPYNGLTYLGGGTGFFYTTVYDTGSVSGEWIEIKFPYKAKIKAINVKPVAGNYAFGPRAGKVLGSDNGTTWFFIGDYSAASTPSNIFYTSTFPSNTKRFQYIRFVVTGCGSAVCSMGSLKYDMDIYDLTADMF